MPRSCSDPGLRSLGLPLPARSRIALGLKLLAPWLAVAIFWLGLENGWLAILAYHAQIVFWARGRVRLPRLALAGVLPLALPMLGAGPLLGALLPYVTRGELTAWLAEFRLSGSAFALMIPYFGLVHPLLEQLHWGPLRERTPWAHVFFAGYHGLVLVSLLRLPWLVLCTLLLVGASVTWQHMARRTGSLGAPVASHAGADLGVILAAWLRA